MPSSLLVLNGFIILWKQGVWHVYTQDINWIYPLIRKDICEIILSHFASDEQDRTAAISAAHLHTQVQSPDLFRHNVTGKNWQKNSWGTCLDVCLVHFSVSTTLSLAVIAFHTPSINSSAESVVISVVQRRSLVSKTWVTSRPVSWELRTPSTESQHRELEQNHWL